MREIKFRAWDTIKKEWDDDFVIMKGKVYKYDFDFEYEEPAPHLMLMQYTGLKDKGGKEIYEGDIVLWHSDSFFEIHSERLLKQVEIKWINGGFHLFKTNIDLDVYLGAVNDQCEIVGNIYQHPELLESS